MTPVLAGIIGFLIMFVVFFAGLEIGFSMAVVGFLGFSLMTSFHAGTNVMAKDIFDVFSSYSLTVIPLFILMGQVAANSGIGKKLYHSAFRFIGHVPGGLAMATVVGCTLFGAICGSSTATAATFTTVSVPEMRRYRYSDKLIGGVIASSGGIGIMIPPSVIFIVYGVFTQQSIGRLFMAGIFPGIMICTLFIVAIYLWCLKDTRLGPKGETSTWKERFRSLPGAIEIIILFVIVMGGMLKGFFTPTEGGAVGAFAILLLTMVRRSISLKDVGKSIMESLVSSCMIMVIVAGATIFGHFLTISTIPFKVAEWVGTLPLHNNVIMGMILFIYLIGGCVLDALALIILTIPIFYPVIIQLGFDPIWFGVIIVLVTMMGVITPPIGMNSYVVAGVSKIPLATVFQGIWPFLIALCIAAVILIAFPGIATFLPTLLMGT
jgi:C4-dicarboxylate transporter DctM subunit